MNQRGIHWPYCIDGRCAGCMPAMPEDWPPCAPALGIHRTGCDCPGRPTAEGRP